MGSTDTRDFVILAILLIVWCALHSAMFSTPVTAGLQKRLGTGYRFYRLFFNTVALVTLAPVLWFEHSLRGEALFDWPGYWRIVQVLLLGDDVSLGTHLALASPELVPVDEKVRELGVVAIVQHVLELRRADGEVVQHQIELEPETEFAESLDVLGGDELLVELVVDDREAPIQVAVKESGQDVEKREAVLELR